MSKRIELFEAMDNSPLSARFEGTNGRQHLADALVRQPVINGDAGVAAELAAVSDIIDAPAGAVIMRQDAADNDVYFILSGSVSILVNGRQITDRRAGSHVGEMALIDVQARRAATVIANVDTVLARVSEQDFSRIANNNPVMWRRLAIELAERLRQRNQLVPPKNDRPRVFVGSSVEGLAVARALQVEMQHDPFTVTIWNQGVFEASKAAIASLEAAAKEADIAVLVLSGDDTVISRGAELQAPRDNVVFELGLFAGAIGQHRTFIIQPRGAKLKIPTDLLGVGILDYVPTSAADLPSSIGPACTELRHSIKRLGPK